jgi:hypothetical protein
MQVNGTCNKCGNQCWFEIGDATREQVAAMMDKPMGECPCNGHHVELGNMSRYIELDWDTLREGERPLTTDEFRAQLVEKGYTTFTTEELRANQIEITGFAFGLPMAKRNGAAINLDFASAPDGTRIYFVRNEEMG